MDTDYTSRLSLIPVKCVCVFTPILKICHEYWVPS